MSLVVTALGCASWVDGRRCKVESARPVPVCPIEGFHYALPAAVIRATPQADGTTRFEKQVLPDWEQQYVLKPGSVLAAYRFEIKLEGGLLTSVQFNPNSAVLAAQIAKSAGDTGKAYFEASQTGAAEKKKAQDAADAALTEYNIAQAKVEKLKTSGIATAAQILEAEIAAEAARLKHEAARRAADLDPIANAAGAPVAPGTFPKAAGPVFYRLVWREESEDFALVATPQGDFPTVSAKQVGGPLKGLLKDSPVTRRGKNDMRIVIVPSEPLAVVDDAALLRDRVRQDALKPARDLLSDGSVAIILKDTTPDGEYVIEVRARTAAKPAEPQRMTVGIEVRGALP